MGFHLAEFDSLAYTNHTDWDIVERLNTCHNTWVVLAPEPQLDRSDCETLMKFHKLLLLECEGPTPTSTSVVYTVARDTH